MSLFSLFNDPYFSEFDRLFDDAFARRTGTAPTNNNGQLQRHSGDAVQRARRPFVDVHEDKENNLVTAAFELPGLAKEDINIDVHNNVLTVSGETKSETNKDEKGFVLRERRFGRFSRSIPVPEGIKPEEVKASLDNGVLTVSFPRQTPEQAPKKITIS